MEKMFQGNREKSEIAKNQTAMKSRIVV